MTAKEDLNMDYSKYDFKDSTELYIFLSRKGLSRGTIEEISKMKGEPDWMRDFRLRSYEVFLSKPMPNWGGDLSKIDFQNIYYYAKASEKTSKSWDDVPESVRNTFEKLGIPEAERKFLSRSRWGCGPRTAAWPGRGAGRGSRTRTRSSSRCPAGPTSRPST